jgi:LAO/AO transport system kinase
VDDLRAALDDHHDALGDAGAARERHAATVRAVLREEVDALVDAELDRRGGVDDLAARVAADETDPHAAVAETIDAVARCLAERRQS